MRAGAIPVPLNIKLPAESLAFIAKDANLSLLFVDAAHRKVAPDVPTVDFDATYADFLKPGPFAAVEPTPDDICLQPYTSGSTGRPKGVLLTHAGQAWQIDALVKARRMTPRRPHPRRRPALPQERARVDQGRHGRGRLARAAGPLRPAPLRGVHRPLPVTRLSGVPTMFHLILNDPALASTDESSVRFVGRGLRARLARALRGAPPRLPERGGQQRLRRDRGGPGDVRRSSKWFTQARYVHRLPAGDGCEIRLDPGPDEGVLAHANPGVMAAYHNLPEETAGA